MTSKAVIWNIFSEMWCHK